MLTEGQFNALLQGQQSLVIDGGLATELEAQGFDMNHPLWSAKLLRDNQECIENLHLDYYLAGADIAITASYQASIEGFRCHFGMDEKESADLIKRSVKIAINARETALCTPYNRDRGLLVAGSVGPFGAYLADGSEYRGDYTRSKEELQCFHRPRIHALVEAGVDLLALETMPQLSEIEALLEMLRTEFTGTLAWLSCTLADSGHISDGTCIQQVLRVINQYQDVVVAFGINCVPTEVVAEALDLMKRRTKLPLICYANSGEVWDAETKTWSSGDFKEYDWFSLAQEWQKRGARIIGGCCRTGPKHVNSISRALSRGAPATLPDDSEYTRESTET